MLSYFKMRLKERSSLMEKPNKLSAKSTVYIMLEANRDSKAHCLTRNWKT